MNLLDTFNTGMHRDAPTEFLPPIQGKAINLGAGSSQLLLCDNLDRSTGWVAPILPYAPESVAAVYAFHFMEHLPGDVVVVQLREIERVLKPGGIFNSVIPHWSCELAHQDLDHKSFWSETTWDNLMMNPNYLDRGDWMLHVRSCVIMGIVSRNLVIVSQLVKM